MEALPPGWNHSCLGPLVFLAEEEAALCSPGVLFGFFLDLNIWLTWAEVWGKPHPWGQELSPKSHFGMRLEFSALLGAPQGFWGTRNVLAQFQCCF